MTDLPVIVRGLSGEYTLNGSGRWDPPPLEDRDRRKQGDHERLMIVDSWVRSLCFLSYDYSWFPHKLVQRRFRPRIIKLMFTKPGLFVVAINEDDEKQVFGWCCKDQSAVHFVYVKEEFRGYGLSEKLIGVPNDKGWIFSQWTKACDHIPNLTYKPSAFYKRYFPKEYRR